MCALLNKCLILKEFRTDSQKVMSYSRIIMTHTPTMKSGFVI